MKKVLLIVLALVLCLSVTASAEELLFNGDFELAEAHDAFWQVTGSDGVRDLNSCLGNPGPPTPATGAWGLMTASGWGVNQTSALNETYVNPGNYSVILSGWLRVEDSGNSPSTADLILFVDDVEVGRQGLSFVNTTNPGNWASTGWQQKTISWSGLCNGKFGVKINLVGNGAGGPNPWPYGLAFADGISLATVPEPGSMLALISGLAGFGGMIIRRRK